MLGEIISILAVLTFVGSNVIFRQTERDVSPTFINLFRTGIGTFTFFIFLLVINQFHSIFIIPWQLWLLLILSFVFGQVIGDTAYFTAQKELGTTIALAISMTFPVFTFIISLIFLRRVFTLKLVIALILIGFGITIIGKSKINSESSIIPSDREIRIGTLTRREIIKAIGFCITASLGWAIGAVIIEFTISQIDQIINLQELSSLVGNVIRFPFATMILGTMVLRENYKKRNKEIKIKNTLNRRTWLLLITASIIGTSLGAYLYTEAIHLAGANVMSLIASASPLFSLPLTYLVNKEKISKYGFIGVILTILGVILILV